jgi:acyl-homoserine-lactone acylase
MRRIPLVSAALSVILAGGMALAASPGADAASSAGASLAGRAGEAGLVKIVTDSAGIPHITASSFTALGFGEAHAFAADDFCTLAEDFVTVNGARSKYFGPDGITVDYSDGGESTNLQSDAFWQSVKESSLFKRETSAPPPVGPLPQVRQLYQGFVNGYNAFLASGRLHDPTCAGRPWVRPITVEDLFLRMAQIVMAPSSGALIAAEAAAAPPTSTSTATPAARPPDPAALTALRENGNSAGGSNGIAVGSKDTRAGDGMVLANPHFPWQGEDRFWMTQLTVPGRYDMEGGTLFGFPLIGIGFNSDVAWTHTDSTALHFTFYQLKLVPGDPTSYYVNGKATPMGKDTVTVDTGSGLVRHTFYTTRWGTVVDLPQAGFGWSTATAYTLDDANYGDEWRAANEYLQMGQATSVRGLLAVQEKDLADPSFNTMASDDHGDALYADVENLPGVSGKLFSECLPPGLATVVYQETGLITLDGSTTACAWQHSKGTPISGILDGSQQPHTIRTDYVENSNDSYWLANPSAPFPAYSPIIGNIDVPQGLRTRLGNEMIAERVAGTDGLGSPKFSIPTMQAMWENDRSLLAELVLPQLVSACKAAPVQTSDSGVTVNLTNACVALTGYEKYKNGDLDASGGWLFTLWYASLNSGQFWSVPFNPAKPLTTPSGLNTANPDILRALADAVLNLQANHLPLDASFGRVQHATRGKDVIPVHGCATGCFNAIDAVLTPGDPETPGDYGEVVHGSSLVITTELSRSGPVAQGILTYSQATNPLSPWYANMTKLYSAKKWVKLAYTPAQLAAEPGNQTMLLRS